ncbi:hypothetical protein ACRRVC_01120 [Candidatus Cardinium hertigii]
MTTLSKWCQEHKHQPIAWQTRYLNAVPRGHYNYYGVTGNYPSISSFYRHVVNMWHKYLGRRSQRGYIKWDKYRDIIKRYGLIKPYLPHSVLYNYCQFSC